MEPRRLNQDEYNAALEQGEDVTATPPTTLPEAHLNVVRNLNPTSLVDAWILVTDALVLHLGRSATIRSMRGFADFIEKDDPESSWNLYPE